MIEGTEDENDLDINWSTACVGGFKRLILWVEGTEDKNDLNINWWKLLRYKWSTAFMGALKD